MDGNDVSIRSFRSLPSFRAATLQNAWGWLGNELSGLLYIGHGSDTLVILEVR